MNRFFLRLFASILVAGWGLRIFAAGPTNAPAAATNAPVAPPVIKYLTPQEEQETFLMQDGYSMELVVGDPVIKEPVLAVFDGNGRMFVAEMRSYMQDIDGRDERARNSRISMHWSSKGDGVFDKHSIFVDNLILPRMILPLADGILINETDSEDIWLYRDTKGTGTADSKTLFYAGGGRGGNLEHQPSGLIWDLDNWLYMSVNTYRLRIKGTNILRENTPANLGQWGLCQDDYGKLFNINAGFESGPVHYQVPLIYDHDYNYNEDVQFVHLNYQEVYPVVGLADVQGGTPRFRPDNKTLNHFTGTCGDQIYRGDRLPAELRGDLFFCEPVGRLVSRSKVVVKEGFTRLDNAYDKAEFIRSTDPDFRPVNIANAPDGTMYIVDMYRGIIQEKDWVGQGSYLRGVVQQFNLDKNFGRGRIWRVVYKGMKPGPQPHMLNEKPEQLVNHLASSNGWTRDTAQKLLVLRGDKSVVPALRNMAESDPGQLARIHALWTLEGLDALDPAIIREKLGDSDPQVRIAAIRTSESLYKSGDHSVVSNVMALAKDPSTEVQIQLCLSAELMKWPGWEGLLKDTVANNKAYGVQKLIGPIVPAPPPPPPAPGAPQPAPPPARPLFTAVEKQTLDHGETIYKQLCFACHGLDGAGTPLQGAAPGTTMAPPLRRSKTANGYRDGVISVVLKGLNGPVDGKNYTAQMVPMESNDDAWIASVISYIRNSFGNHSSFITSNEVARVRAAIVGRPNPWTLQELHSLLPHAIENRQEWHLTASHNPATLRFAIDGDPNTRYDTGAPQTPGMWVQIELPQPTEIAGVELDSTPAQDDYPRAYKVQLSDDGQNWDAPVAMGNSAVLHNQIIFKPTTTKFLRITQTGADPHSWWSIYDLQVLKYPSAEDLVQMPELFPEPAPEMAPVAGTAASAGQAAAPEPEPEFTPYTVQ